MIDRLRVLETLHHLLLQLRVGNLGTDGDTALDRFLDLSDQGHQLCRGLDVLGDHTTRGGVEGGDLEDSVCLLDVLDLDLSLQMNPSDGFGQSDDGLKLTHCDGDASAPLGDLLVLGVHSVGDVHVLEDLSGFL